MSKVLIVDDNPSSAAIADYALRMPQQIILHSSDPLRGMLDLLNEKPKLIVLDWLMPEMTGGELLLTLDKIFKQLDDLKKLESKEKIDVIIYSSLNLHQMTVPQTQYFHILCHIFKKWPVGKQVQKFKSIFNHLQHRGAA